MEEKIESDILIEGEGITAVALAYFLSEYKKNETINLVLREQEELNLSLFNPGLILPVFQLPNSLIGTVFQRNINLLEELNTVTQDFEFAQNPLVLLYRDKDSITKMKEHQEKLKEANLKHANLTLEEIESYYPFIRTEKEVHIIEVYDTYTCSNPYDLFTSFRKLAEENDVYIIREKEKIEVKNNKNLMTPSTEYSGKNMVVTTSYYNQHNSELRRSNLVKVITPIIERFPKISLFDSSSASFMWLEEAGYFHIFSSVDKTKEKESLDRIKKGFEEMFSFSQELEILDVNYRRIEFLHSIEKSLGYMENNGIFYLNIPPHLEPSLSPIISERIAKLSDEKADSFKEPNSIFKLFKR